MRLVLIFAVLLATHLAAAQVRPPFDPTKRVHGKLLAQAVPLIESADPKAQEQGLDIFRRSIAAAPQAGDTDYAIAWIAYGAAKLCRHEETLEHYKLMRTYFTGWIVAGAGGAMRNWDVHLGLTRALLGRCGGRQTKKTLAAIATMDRAAAPLPLEQLYAPLTPSEAKTLRQPMRLDMPVQVVGAWRFDPRTDAWISYIAVNRPTGPVVSRAELPDRAAPAGHYAAIWQGKSSLVVEQLDTGTPDCTVRDASHLDDMITKRSTLRCVPGWGMTEVPRFDALKVLTPRELAIARAAGDVILQRFETAQPTPTDVDIAFRRNGKTLEVSGRSDYGRTLELVVERLLVFEPKSSTWKVVSPVATKSSMRTRCSYLCGAAQLSNRTEETSDAAVWTTLAANAVPALYYMRGALGPQRIDQTIFTGDRLCTDVVLGPPPTGMVATCVPSERGATARFVPIPR